MENGVEWSEGSISNLIANPHKLPKQQAAHNERIWLLDGCGSNRTLASPSAYLLTTFLARRHCSVGLSAGYRERNW
ncbi:hypothetical protein Pint_24476 [Pistacia integerrima]|uniref:Uncharacterized protein n=1 Tax=Pistacia integerrima TaxID=434235 RepID=A0ACC0YDU5_9ROSI|nr:hypothetical protein Pint_24476 [Pistacia integerrima]